MVTPYVGMNEKTRWRLHYYIQCISVQTLIFRLVMNSRHLDLLSGVAPSYGSKEIARNCY